MQGMELLTDYDHVAVFDADFKPDPEFLVGLSATLHACSNIAEVLNACFCTCSATLFHTLLTTLKWAMFKPAGPFSILKNPI